MNKRKRQTVKPQSKKSEVNKSDWWDEISDAEKASILRGLEDIKAGRTIPHEKVKKMYQKWLK